MDEDLIYGIPIPIAELEIPSLHGRIEAAFYEEDHLWPIPSTLTS